MGSRSSGVFSNFWRITGPKELIPHLPSANKRSQKSSSGLRRLKAVQELLGHADLKMTMRYAHLSQEHLRDSVNLLNDLPSGKEMVNIASKGKKADNPEVANLL